ncbi:MAG: glycosyltransferase [Chloroflexota bacterium]
MRVCYFGTYRASYARNVLLIHSLRLAGVDVIECHEALWHSVEDRVQVASGGWLRPRFWLRVFSAYRNLLRKYRQIGNYDVLVVGYPGQYDVFLARLLSWWSKKPLVWDVFNSMYLVMLERGIAKRHGFTAGLVRFLEKTATHLPEMMFLDGSEFVAWFHKIHAVSPQQFRIIPMGADKNELPGLLPPDFLNTPNDEKFRMIHYGSYITNHGVETIIEAAHILEKETHFVFEMIGDGPEKAKAVNLAKSYQLKNLVFTPWLGRPELARKIADANVVLGSFGKTLQASLTYNNKILEALSLKKAVINGTSPANPSSLIHGQHLYLVERADPQALAEAILTLQADPRLCQQLGENGYRILCEHFDALPLGQLYQRHLAELLAGRGY